MQNNEEQTLAPHRIELPFPGGAVNVYLFLTPEPVLIDAGFNSSASWQALQGALRKHGITPADLVRVIITHPHVDHYGLAAKIVAAGHAQIWMADVGVAWLRDFPYLWQQRINYYRDTLLPGIGLPPAARQSHLDWMIAVLNRWEPISAECINAFPSGGKLALGGLDWQTLHLPGHDDCLTVFHQPETRQLLSADALIIPTATPVIGAPAPGEARQPALPQMMNSLDRLAQLEVETVHPGHGAPFGDQRAVIRAQQARIRERTEECWRLLADGASTVAEVFDRLYGPRAAAVGLAGLWMVVGYLDLLVGAERITVEERDSVWRYHPVV